MILFFHESEGELDEKAPIKITINVIVVVCVIDFE